MRVQQLMAVHAGPIRDELGLQLALAELALLRDALGEAPPTAEGAFDTNRLDWFDLRNMLLVAETVTGAALARQESRGAHQRRDFPLTSPNWELNQTLRWASGVLTLGRVPCVDAATVGVAE
jgi:succinate dehydrogenase / fumarate reductase flavoprotein subunit/fumarate reductase (CoM/CoB) subunit A